MLRSSLRSSSTCRSRRVGTWAVWRAVAMAVVRVASPRSRTAPQRDLSQCLRDRWGRSQGFPGGPVHGITQSEDGYLWIAAERGLVRFDGLTFRLYQPTPRTSGTGPTVLGVSSDPDGSVWTRLRGPALFRHRRGQFEDLPPENSRPDSVVTGMIRAPDGSTLIATLGQGVIRYRKGRFETIAIANVTPLSFAISIAQDSAGVVWAGTRDVGLLRIEQSRVTRITEGLPDQKINALLPDEEGGLWIGTDGGVGRWHDGRGARECVPADLVTRPALAFVLGRGANV